jgi:hypothetical protein
MEELDDPGPTRQKLIDILWKIKQYYNAPEPTDEDSSVINGGNVVSIKLHGDPSIIMKPRAKHIRLQGTPGFWQRLETLDNDSRIMGLSTTDPELYCALYDRLKNSIIKVAILLCGADLRDKITEEDLQRAIYYGEEWLQYATDFAVSIEQKPDLNKYERKMDKIASWIRTSYPTPHNQTEIMQKFRLRKSEMPDIEETMIRRGMVSINPHPASSKTLGTKIWYSVPPSYLAGKNVGKEANVAGTEDEEEGGTTDPSPIRIRSPKRS